MANVKKKKHNRKAELRKIWALIGPVLLLLAIALFECYYTQQVENNNNQSESEIEIIDSPLETTPVVQNGELLYLHMINCGQADSFLFEQNGEYGLIDCGTRSTGDDVVKYLKKEGVNELQFVVGTHPHDDHMGGMQTVIENIKCNRIYMPKVETGQITANWYISLLSTIKKNKLKTTNPKVNDVFMLGKASFTVVGQFTPKEAGENINNYSTVIKVSFGEMDVLMTGDAEVPVEKKMLESNIPLQCEILKVGHHGSTTSTSLEFLQAVSPDYALISSGIGNRYNHPCADTLKKLKKEKITLYRTDENSDVIVVISSNDIKIDEKPGDYIDGPTLAKKKGVA